MSTHTEPTRELPPAATSVAPTLSNTHWALCFIAFAIAPLNIVQREVFTVTLNLPEALILLLAAKEAALILLGKQRFTPLFPAKTVGLFLFTAVAAGGTGFLYGNGAVRVLQDFRQFTEFILLFWLVVQTVRTREQAFQIVLCYVLGVAVVAVHGIAQQFLPPGPPASLLVDRLMLFRQERSGSFYGPTPLGALMVLGVGSALGVGLADRRRAISALMLACGAACIFAAYFSQTRASWLAIFLASAFAAAWIRPPRRILFVAGAGATALALVVGAGVAARIGTLADPLGDISLVKRMDYYAAAAHIFRAHPILGLGWGTYYEIHRIVAVGRYAAVPRPSGAPDATVHSAYLQLLVKTGLLGVVGLGAVLAVWLDRVRRAWPRSRPSRPDHLLCAGVTAALVGYLAHSSVENFFQWPVMAQSFWLLLGISYLTAHWNAAGTPSYIKPISFLTAAALFFAGFLCGTVHLQTQAPRYYQENVARALAEGDPLRAAWFAERAVRAFPRDPMAYAVHGRALLAAGSEDDGIGQLLTAVHFDTEIGADGQRQPTRRPFYLAPARLTLGVHFFERGDSVRALRQFELAGAYADLADPAYAAYHDVLYRAYAGHGLWGRALAFGRPGPEDLDGMPAEGLLALARAAEARGLWETASDAAERIMTREDRCGEARFILAHVAQAHGEANTAHAHLERAAALGYAPAAYALGAALADAGEASRASEAFASVAPDHPYRPFALARMIGVLDGVSDSAALLSELTAFIDALPRTETLPGEAAPGYVPIAAAVPSLGPCDARLPLLVLWEDPEAASDAPLRPVVETGSGDTLLLRLDGRILQLQWAENRVNWAAIECLPAGTCSVPGWIDTAREWFNLRTDRAVCTERDQNGEALLRIVKPTWLYSLPVQAESWGYLIAGCTRDPEGMMRLGWQALDAQENLLTRQSFIDRRPHADWRPFAVVLATQPEWEAVRLHISVAPRSGDVAAAQLLLVALERPAE